MLGRVLVLWVSQATGICVRNNYLKVIQETYHTQCRWLSSSLISWTVGAACLSTKAAVIILHPICSVSSTQSTRKVDTCTLTEKFFG